MGDVSIIARRLEGGTRVQYGWSGNGGYYRNVGDRLLAYYNDPEMVEYLFSLGQMRPIGQPGSENGGESNSATNQMTGEPHYVGKSEREIFSKIMFVDYGYFYDTDHVWYYVFPGAFCIKIPLEYIHLHLDDSGYEYDALNNIERQLTEYLLTEYYHSGETLQAMVAEKYPQGIEEVRKDVMGDDYPCHALRKKYKWIFDYFDDWVVVETDEEYRKITGFKVRVKQNETDRVETMDW